MTIADDLFAGAGGWDLAAAQLGIHARGVENMKEARATRDAAGLTTIHDDVWTFRPDGKADGLIASPPCFAAGTPVLTKRGSVSIEEVAVGDEVWTHENRWRPVTAVMSRKSEMVKVGPVVTTPDHRFYSRTVGREWRTDVRHYRRTLGTPEWTPAADLKGRFLASPLAIDAKPVDSWPVDPWLAGRYVADGWTGRDGIMVAVGDGKDAEFRAESRRQWTTAATGPSCTRYTTPDHDGAAWLAEHFGRGAKAKTIATFVFGETEEVRRRFLAGYLSGDGTVTESGWVANTTSAHLASQLRLLAIGLGYAGNFLSVTPPPTKVIQGRTVNQSPYWSVIINRGADRYTVDEFGLRWFKQRKEIKTAGFGTVYDITVEEDHSFTAWGYVVHNCQTFSAAGKGSGRKALDDVLRLIDKDVPLYRSLLRSMAADLGDERTALVLAPLHFALRGNYQWLAWEQVPTVLPAWEACAERLRRDGWHVWTGLLHAEQYGVPQTRKRAFLLASRNAPVGPPEPTHSRYYSRDPGKLDMGVAKWVSMAEALGFGLCERPAPTVTGGGTESGGAEPIAKIQERWASRRDWMQRRNSGPGAERPPRSVDEPAYTVRASGSGSHPCGIELLPEWTFNRPSTTIVGSFKPEIVAAPGYRTTVSRQNAPNSVRVTVQEAGVLQSFPHDFAWQGAKGKQFLQAGNAVPPGLALHALSSAAGASLEAGAA